MRRLSLFVFIFICCKVSAQFKVNYYPNGKIKSEGSYSLKDTLKQGPWKYYFNSGKINLEASYFNNKNYGEWRYYHLSNGTLEKIEYWKDGLLQGNLVEYYPNGKIYKSGHYLNGAYEGSFSSYYENGQLKNAGSYKLGLPEGCWESYNEKGFLIEEGNYQNGKKNGYFLINKSENALDLVQILYLEDVELSNDKSKIGSKEKKELRRKRKRK